MHSCLLKCTLSEMVLSSQDIVSHSFFRAQLAARQLNYNADQRVRGESHCS
jgi:hypothetical protein